MKPIQKSITLGTTTVQVVSHQPDPNIPVVEAAATVGNVVYAERWTLPTENPDYSLAQAQKDFDAHIQKVAAAAVGRFVSQQHLDSLQ